MYVQAGVGVVGRLDLEAEYQESVLKARALVRRRRGGRPLRQRWPVERRQHPSVGR